MTQYINYADLSPTERLVFNSTGQCPAQYIMTEGEYMASVNKATGQEQISEEFTVEVE